MIKVASATLNQTPLDWKGNTQRIIAVLNASQKSNIQVLCLPEMSICGYGCEDAFLSDHTLRQSIEILFELLPHTQGLFTGFGLPLKINNKIYNAICVVADGEILGFVCKQNLPNYGIFYEKRWFEGWENNKSDSVLIQDKSYPVGDLIFSVSGVKIAFEICEDAWVQNRPGSRFFQNDVQLILNPSASPFSFGKHQTRLQLVQKSSEVFNCSYLYANLCGNESGRLIFDGDTFISSKGKLLAVGERFVYDDYHINSCVVDIAPESTPIDTANFIFSALNFNLVKAASPCLETNIGTQDKETEFSLAISLALFDYLRKSRSFGFTISLSGGADSAACLALCSLMIDFATEMLGFEKLLKKLSYIPNIEKCTSKEELKKKLIHCIYQQTKNSSENTYNAAQTLAKDINATFYSIEIDSVVAGYTQLIEQKIGRKLSWETDDLALQNIQARVRAPSVWLLANINNHLLLTTSNRSEAAVGYCTMDGDTAGSITPISGVDKAWLRTWLMWQEKVGCRVNHKIYKIPGLKIVNTLHPTAELRPINKVQTDEADLMPYPILNQIERLAIFEKKSPKETFIALIETGYPKENLLVWVKRFYTLWSRNQWKRERYALGFHVDDYNLDPKSWCRFPVLNGSFVFELEELEKFYQNEL